MHNRLYYTQFSFPRLLEECQRSERFSKLYVTDDNSEDGSSEFVQDLISCSPLQKDIVYKRQKIGNSIDCINYATHGNKTAYYFKVDNDILIPEGCFDVLAGVMDKESQLGFLMLVESQDFPYVRKGGITLREHIGGVGIFRGQMFTSWIGNDNRYWGFTKFQQIMSKKGWAAAQYDGGTMTLLDRSKSYARGFEYKDKGWGRVINGNEVYSPFEPEHIFKK